jgi:hypothetical protein
MLIAEPFGSTGKEKHLLRQAGLVYGKYIIPE